MRPVNNALNFGTFYSASLNPASVSSQNSIAQWATDIIRASFQVVFVGAATGSIKMQASNDFAVGLPREQFQPTNWNDVGSSVSVTAAGSYLIPEIECSYEYIRLVYTSTTLGAQTIALVNDVSGSLNNKYFLLNDAGDVNKYYVWFDINGAGVDPAIVGRTGVPITGATNATAATLGTAMASAIAALNSTNSFTTAGTSTVTVTNKVAGAFTAAVDGAAPTGFTFAQTVGTGTMSGRICAKSL